MNAFWASENFEAFIVFRSSQPREWAAQDSNKEWSSFPASDQFYADWRGWSNGRAAELVGVAQPIARCGECGGIGRWRLVFQRGVRSLAVVVDDPAHLW